MVAVIDEVGALAERVEYDAYGRARHHRASDFDADGAGQGSDQGVLLGATWDKDIGDADYNADCDLNRDGTIDVDDYALFLLGTGSALDYGLISDRLGPDSPIGYDGYVFAPEAGLDLPAASPLPAGVPRPALGAYCVRFRWYVPEVGRWAQRDPIGYVDGFGLFEYTRSGPPTRLDPSGLDDLYWEDVRGRKHGQMGTWHHLYRRYNTGFLWLEPHNDFVRSHFTPDEARDCPGVVDDHGYTEYQRRTLRDLDTFATTAADVIDGAYQLSLVGASFVIPGPDEVAVAAIIRTVRWLRGLSGGTRLTRTAEGWRVHPDGRPSYLVSPNESRQLDEAIDELREHRDTLHLDGDQVRAADCDPCSTGYSATGDPHRSNVRPSSRQRHEDGQARRQRDQGGERGDRRRPYRKDGDLKAFLTRRV